MRTFWLVTLAVLVAVLSGLGPLQQRQTLILAHNLDVTHPVHLGLVDFARRVNQESGGQLRVEVYPNGQLGSEREVLEQLQLGAVAFTKVSSLSLESFSPLFGVLNAPYVFRDQTHAYRVLDGPVGQELLEAAVEQRIRGLTYYNSGTRSFYADRPILRPEDLAGLKLRVMGSQTAIRMTELLGGSPAPMAYGEIYTAMQQHVIDGAENNLTALTLSRHGEIAKHYSEDEHICAPDVLVVSTAVWARLSPAQRELVARAAEQSKLVQRRLWDEAMADHRAQAAAMGVEFHRVDKSLFAQRVRPLIEEMKARGPDYRRLLEAIENG